MNEPDELRDAIARLDPAREVPTEPITTPDSRAFLEDIMNTTLTPRPDSERPPAERGSSPDRSRRSWWLGAGAAAAVAAIAVAGVAVTGGFDRDADEPDVAVEPTTDVVDDGGGNGGDGEPLVLSLGEGQDAMASCMAPSAEALAPVPLAFAGVATEVDGEAVRLDVTEWYVGGEAASVELTAPAGLEALIGGIDFQVGETYLVSAFDGIVNYCGFSGPATPELQQMYDAAFPG